MNKRIRVLVIDDSALVRRILTDGLAQDPDIEVVGAASDPYIARDKIVDLKPDVLTLDVEMPRMDGVEFLRKLMPQYPLPVLMVSALTQKGKRITLDALEAGAVDFVTKPSTDISRGLSEMLDDLCEKVKAVSKANVSGWKSRRSELKGPFPTNTRSLAESTDKVIVIGASTGGTEAIRTIVTQLPPFIPGVVIVQHMPPGFTRMFADRINEQCTLTVKEAADDDRIMNGTVMIAPGDMHAEVRRSGSAYIVKCREGEKVCGHRPSVDVLFRSAAKYAGTKAIGIILTGMGKDGAEGLLEMRRNGARTLGQDERTSVVYGMPKVAFEIGGVERQLSVYDIPNVIINLLKDRN